MSRIETTEENVMERFYEKLIPVTESGCWLWIGATNSDGYGTFTYKRRGIKAHRFSYQRFVGPLKDDLDIDHLCRVRCCVNPSHLELVTTRVNVMRGNGWAVAFAAKTHCKRGHEFTEENIYRHHKRPTHRICRACWMELYREKRAV